MTEKKGYVLPEPKDLDEALKVARIRHELAAAEREELLAEEVARRMAWDDASEEDQGTYTFTGVVSDDSVTMAIDTLSRWSAYSKKPIVFRVMSPGGVVEDGLALYDFMLGLRAEGIELTTVGIGIAASMGGVLLQAGSRRLVTPNSSMLIHEVASMLFGKTSEAETELGYVKTLQNRVLDILAKRSTLSKREIAKRWKGSEWYLDAKTIVALGFADAIGVR